MRSKQEIEELEAEAELACATSPTYQLMTSPRLKALVRAHHRLTSKPFKGAISRSAIATEANLPMYEATSALAVGWQDYEQACREVALVNARSEAFDVVAQTIRMAKDILDSVTESRRTTDSITPTEAKFITACTNLSGMVNCQPPTPRKAQARLTDGNGRTIQLTVDSNDERDEHQRLVGEAMKKLEARRLLPETNPSPIAPPALAPADSTTG